MARSVNVGFSTTLDNGGASQCLSVILAVMAIEAGLTTTVVCGYGRDSWSRLRANAEDKRQTNLIPSDQRPREHGPEFGWFGAVAPHALGARRHMFEYGTTREDFAAIAVAFREHARRNPDAMMREPLAFDLVRNAKDISHLEEGAFAMAKGAGLPAEHVAVVGRVAEGDGASRASSRTAGPKMNPASP